MIPTDAALAICVFTALASSALGYWVRAGYDDSAKLRATLQERDDELEAADQRDMQLTRANEWATKLIRQRGQRLAEALARAERFRVAHAEEVASHEKWRSAYIHLKRSLRDQINEHFPRETYEKCDSPTKS